MAILQGLKRVLRRYPGLLLGSFIVLVFIMVSLLAPFITPHDPLQVDLSRRLLPPSWMERGVEAHILGTDMLGRDVFSLLIYGARVSFFIALLILVFTCTGGPALGI